MSEAGVIARLRKARLRLSIARIGVMQVLQAAEPEPMCAEDVYRRMSERGTRTSLGTVYRATKELAAHGLLLREWDRHRKAVYRVKPLGFDEHRLRLVCQDCGRSVTLSDGALLTALERVAHAQGLVLAGNAVAIPCECRACDEQAPTAPPCALARAKSQPAVANSG